MLSYKRWRNNFGKISKIPRAKVIELGKCKSKGSTQITSEIEPRSLLLTSTFIRDGLKLHRTSPRIKASLLVKLAATRVILWTVGPTGGVNLQTIPESSKSKVHGALVNSERAKYRVWRRLQGQALKTAYISTRVF